MKDPDVPPQGATKAATLCIHCGHCIAVCPTGSLTLDDTAPDALEEISPDTLPSAHAVETLLKGRRSMRHYTDEPVPQEVLTRIINAASYAPTGHNSRPVEWIAVRDRQGMERLTELVLEWMERTIKTNPEYAKKLHLAGVVRNVKNGNDLIFRDAPNFIAAHAPQTAPTPDKDAVIAVSQAELFAYSLGLGACWAGYFLWAAEDHKPLREYLQVPEESRIYGALFLGYPALQYRRAPIREGSITFF